MQTLSVTVELVLLFPIVVLFTNQIIETWHHADIFAEWRERVALSDGPLAYLFGCMFCLSHWVALTISASLFCSLDLVFTETWVLWIIYSFGVSRGAQWLNDIGHSYIRTPKAPSAEELEEEFKNLREPEEREI